ncbi:hypothetical protein L1049_023647 [Liquidambar formosana]|uniref:Uncharacterized protein n=1 Tax=Liquidambar formosana TaxID=63359 RepID=A0AAP0RUT4_LIQFO
MDMDMNMKVFVSFALLFIAARIGEKVGGKIGDFVADALGEYFREYVVAPIKYYLLAPIGRRLRCLLCFRTQVKNLKNTRAKALGGHQASHKKPRLMMGSGGDLLHHDDLQGSLAKPKTHECSIYGLEFTIGQVLGGYIKRHRAIMSEGVMVAQAEVEGNVVCLEMV